MPKVIVLLSGLTFGGKVWNAGDTCDLERYSDSFPKEVRGTSTLDPNFRDKYGRKWFRVISDQIEPEETDVPEAGAVDGTDEDGATESGEQEDVEPEALACRYCGKPYKSEQWLRNHEEQCSQNDGE